MYHLYPPRELKTPNDYLKIAQHLTHQHDFENAEHYIKQGLYHDVLNIELLYQLATIRCYRADWSMGKKILEQIVKIEPYHLNALADLVGVCTKKADNEGSLAYAQRALALNNNNPKIWNNLSIAHHALSQFIEAQEAAQKCIESDPSFEYGYNSLGRAALANHDFKTANWAYEQSYKINPQFHSSRFNHSLSLLAQGDWQKGWGLYEHRRVNVPSLGAMLSSLPIPEWFPETTFSSSDNANIDYSTKSIIVMTEQGLGDTVQTIRLLTFLKKKYKFKRLGLLVSNSQNVMLPLLATCEGIDEVLLLNHEPSMARIPYYDYFVPVFSLPGRLNVSADTLKNEFYQEKYLSVPVEYQQKWQKILRPLQNKKDNNFNNQSNQSNQNNNNANTTKKKKVEKNTLNNTFNNTTVVSSVKKPKIAFAWSGSSVKAEIDGMDHHRSTHLSLWKNLLKHDQFEWYSIQKGSPEIQLDELFLELPELKNKIINVMNQVDDVVDTAAIMEHMDLIISVDTGMVHVASSIGKEVWMLNRYDSCWRWQGHELARTPISDSYWYPQMKIFNQVTPGNWEEVLQNIENALLEKFK